MAEFWFGDERIAEEEHNIKPDVGDVIVINYDGELREFYIKKKYRFYKDNDVTLRYDLEGRGGWAVVHSFG